MADQSPGTELVAQPEQRDVAVMPGFNSLAGWQLANRIGTAFAASTLVPQHYQNNVANCIVALEMANRMGASPLMVMQNLYIVHGNPGWSSKFLIACFNQSGRFSALRYEFERNANGAPTGCRAWAVERATGERLVGTTVTLAMAQAEGWSTKNGSKWKTMPELMLTYRAAAFFIRTYAPEISMGLQAADEIEDTLLDPGYSGGKPDVRMPRAATPMAEVVQRDDPPPNPPAGAPIDQATGEVHQAANEEEKPEADAAAAPAAEPAATDQPAAQAETKPAKRETKAAATAPAQTIGNTALASEGSKQLIKNRARNNSIDLAQLIVDAGLQGLPVSLDGLTLDAFTALKDALPAAQ